MEINGIKYEPLLVGNIIPVYRFIEGQKTEEIWMDAQNCCYYTYCDGKYDDETSLYDGKIGGCYGRTSLKVRKRKM